MKGAAALSRGATVFAVALAAAASAVAAPAPAPSVMTRFAGTWTLAQRYRPALKTIEGRDPPLRPEARALLQKRVADRRAGRTEDGVDKCLPPGIPRLMWQPRPFMILATPRKITILHEFQHTHRHIYLNENLPPAEELEPLYGGTSAGRWEGEVLVVETTGFNGLTQLDEAGLPQSAEAKVVERFRLVDANTLEDRVSITDPTHYAAPWTTRILFKRAPEGTQIREHHCAEKLLDPQLRSLVKDLQH